MIRPIQKIAWVLTIISCLLLTSPIFSFPTPLILNTGSWITKASMPTARAEAVSGVINGLLYVVGGEDGISSLNVLEVYDPASNNWTTKAPMPTARHGAAAGVIGGKLYVAGGANLPETQKFNTLEVYDPITESWTTKAPMPTARNVPASAVINGKLYVAGGSPQAGGRTNILEEYDPVTDTWDTKAPMPTIRAFPAAAEINGKLYVVGGSTPSVLTGTLEVYDPLTDSWASKTPMPTPRYVFMAAALNGQLYTIGGDPSDSGITSESTINEVYDPATDTWSNEAPLPTARWGITGGVIGGTIYVVGGAIGIANGSNGTPQTVNEAFCSSCCYDVEAPVFSCPQDFSVAKQANQCASVVNYSVPSATDNCTVAAVSCTPTAGSAFPLGTTTVTCTATDQAGNRAPCNFTVTVTNATPSVSAGGPYTVNEGSALTLTASASDADGDSLSYDWDLNGDGVFETQGQSVIVNAPDGPATLTFSVRATDTCGASAVALASVSVFNVSPLVGQVSAPINPLQAGTPIYVSATFTDTGRLDTHTATWNWGDGSTSAGTVTETNGSGSVSGNHTYTAAGVYTLSLTVTDKDGPQTKLSSSILSSMTRAPDL